MKYDVSRTTRVYLTEHLHVSLDGKSVCVKQILWHDDDPSDITVLAANRTKAGRCFDNGMPDYRLTDDPTVQQIVKEVTA